MPKSRKEPAVNTSRYNRPYPNPANVNNLTETACNSAPNSFVDLFDNLDIGCIYNYAIAFVGNNPARKVPTPLPKH